VKKQVQATPAVPAWGNHERAGDDLVGRPDSGPDLYGHAP
jgi:hypothetical protein